MSGNYTEEQKEFVAWVDEVNSTRHLFVADAYALARGPRQEFPYTRGGLYLARRAREAVTSRLERIKAGAKEVIDAVVAIRGAWEAGTLGEPENQKNLKLLETVHGRQAEAADQGNIRSFVTAMNNSDSSYTWRNLGGLWHVADGVLSFVKQHPNGPISEGPKLPQPPAAGSLPTPKP